mmetsp:Transcript_64071/g.134708  ORF Transcript_64071/g.134708 Transcript_64071/m.134708 type:complete len:477 (-) Transcript_64071:22-1452(-)
MFVPPEPKTSTEKILAGTIVPLYCANASQRALWEIGHQRHQKALSEVVKLTDQEEPDSSADVSLQMGWQRSKAFKEDEVQRRIGAENQKLLGSLAEIVQQPGSISKLAQAPRPKIPQRGREAEMKRLKDVTRENQLLVKRLLNVKTSFNRQVEERDYARHRRNVERLKKVPPPAPRQDAKARPKQLAPMAAKALPSSASAAALTSGSREAPPAAGSSAAAAAAASRRTLPPLPKQLGVSRSTPAIGNSLLPTPAAEEVELTARPDEVQKQQAQASAPSRSSVNSHAKADSVLRRAPAPVVAAAAAASAAQGSTAAAAAIGTSTATATAAGGAPSSSGLRRSSSSSSTPAWDEPRQRRPSGCSSTCHSGFRQRSPQVVEIENGEGSTREPSPPDTPALAQSIVAGTLSTSLSPSRPMRETSKATEGDEAEEGKSNTADEAFESYDEETYEEDEEDDEGEDSVSPSRSAVSGGGLGVA